MGKSYTITQSEDGKTYEDYYTFIEGYPSEYKGRLWNDALAIRFTRAYKKHNKKYKGIQLVIEF